jgi:tetratricopeptide (TPR) repeat protein
MTPLEMHERADVLAQEGRFKQAAKLWSAALPGLRKEVGDENPQLAVVITNLATCYASMGRWSKALPYYQDGLARKIRQYGEDDPTCATTLVRIARCYEGLGDARAAISSYRRAIAIFDSHPESDPEIHRIALTELSLLADEAGNREEVGELSRQLVRLAARHFVPGDADWEETLIEASAACLWWRGVDDLMQAVREGAGPAEAIVLLQQLADWLLNRRRTGGEPAGLISRKDRPPVERLAQIVADRRAQQPPEPSDLAIALCDLADAAEDANDLGGALRAVAEALEVLPADDALRYAVDIKARCLELIYAAQPGNRELPLLLAGQERFQEAEPAFRQQLTLLTWSHGAADPGTIAAQDGLGVCLLKMGRLDEAEALLTGAYQMLAVTPDTPAGNMAAITGHLAVLRRHQGQFEEAEQLHETTMELSRQVGERSRAYALALINAGAFYKDVGRLDRARTVYEQAQPIVTEVLGREHPDYVLLLSNLADLEMEFRNADRAVELLDEACSIARSALGERHDFYLTALHNLGSAQHMLGQDAEALATLEHALTLKEEAFGPDNASLAPTLNSLAELHDELGQPDLAEALFERSLKLRTSVYGDSHLSVARAHGMFAQFAWKAGRFGKARTEFSAALSLHRRHLIDLLPGMTDEDRTSYWRDVGIVVDVYTAFALSDAARHPETAGDLYDLQLFSKSLMLQCVVSMRTAAAASGEEEVRRRYDDWLAAKRLLASALVSEGPQDAAAGVDQLSARAAELEKDLARLIGHDVILASVGDVSWRDVRGALAPSEAAIEVVRSPLSGFPSSAEPVYAALVLRGDAAGPPQVIMLGPAAALEGPALERYLQHLEAAERGPYDDFWRPLSPALAGITRAYVAPDGIYSRLDLNVLFNGDEDAFLGDALDLRVVASSRDILSRPAPLTGDRTAALFGRPAYTAPARAGGQPSPPTLFDAFEVPGHFPDLPGTEIEVSEIASILGEHGWQVEQFLAERASKAAIQQLVRPRALHLATHGFYFGLKEMVFNHPTRGAFAMVGPLEEDAPGGEEFFRILADQGFTRSDAPAVSERAGSQTGLDPLFRSGVVLAGASGGPSGTADPAGILTAYEAAALNLSGTELVVLSACDSALGEIRTGEGTFGLMRALRAAGAQCVLGAVWPVADTTAQEFMTLFYRAWAESGDARRALKNTQQAMQDKYYEPIFWGGFVLVA